jgi:hypothetical protein
MRARASGLRQPFGAATCVQLHDALVEHVPWVTRCRNLVDVILNVRKAFREH